MFDLRRIDPRRAVAVLMAAAALVVYPALNGIYRPENGDDAWSLSFLYNYVRHGIEDDVTFGTTPATGGQNGVQLFGKLQAAVYGPLLEPFDWTRAAAHTVSTLVILLAAVMWGLIAATATRNRWLGLFMALAMLLLEPFFAAANQARPDALAFLCASLAALAAVRGRFLLAGFAAVAAFEVHAMGAIAVFYVAAACATRWLAPGASPRESVRDATGLAAGGLLGLAGYAWLHADHLAGLPAMLFGNNADSGAGYLYEYFFRTKYLRHLPELAIFGACIGAFAWKRLWRDIPFAGWLLIATAASLLVLRRANFHYTLYAYPALILAGLVAADRLARPWALPALLLTLLLPQYAAVWHMNRSFDFDRYLAALRDAVPVDARPVVGNPNAWFALRDRPFYAADYGPDAFDRLQIKRFYLIETGSFRSDPRYAALKDHIATRYRSRVVKELALFGDDVVVRSCRAR